MMQKEKLPGMKIVEIRCKLPEWKRDKLNIISAIRKETMSDMLEKCIDEIIAQDESLKVLKEAGKA